MACGINRMLVDWLPGDAGTNGLRPTYDHLDALADPEIA